MSQLAIGYAAPRAGAPSAVGAKPRASIPTLEDLLTAVGVNRDGAAFATLFDHFGPRVRAQMMQRGLAPVAAADIVQDVMEAIWSKAHLFDRRKSAAATWIFHIARNRRIDVRRRSRELPCAMEDFCAIPDPGQPHDDRIDQAARECCVRAALGALPHEQFTLIKLAFFDGLPHGAIAQQTNLPLGTVKSRLRLALARLRRSLHDAGVTEA
ncbi:MAG TPA: sigma-70 family RNA polymerase sigma factor [Xanthobacteraceae bacterium]|nr:sigma-70 family RNA polymerase sigma factor [Xanthobacteraceae bacterium]